MEVSIIIPVFNVEKYISKCLRSVSRQTFRDIEIIIVNDGSTDGSLIIINQYAETDVRISVINKRNGGLSSARNAGIKCAKGRYIMFVDSDDYICPDMVEKLYTSITKSHSNMACCNYDFCNEVDEVCGQHAVRISKQRKYSAQESIDLLLYEDWFKCYAWNKLYDRKLFNDIEYPNGKLFEDIITSYKLLKKCNQVVFIPQALYHYRIRENSITQTKFDSRKYQQLEPINYIYSDTDSKKVRIGCLLYYLYFIDDMIIADKWDQTVYKKAKYIYRKYFLGVTSSAELGTSRKIQMMACFSFLRLYKKLYKSVGKK